VLYEEDVDFEKVCKTCKEPWTMEKTPHLEKKIVQKKPYSKMKIWAYQEAKRLHEKEPY